MEKITKVEAFIDPRNWKPNFTRISADTGIGLDAISKYYKRNKNKFEMSIKNLSEIEIINKQEEQNE